MTQSENNSAIHSTNLTLEHFTTMTAFPKKLIDPLKYCVFVFDMNDRLLKINLNQTFWTHQKISFLTVMSPHGKKEYKIWNSSPADIKNCVHLNEFNIIQNDPYMWVYVV